MCTLSLVRLHILFFSGAIRQRMFLASQCKQLGTDKEVTDGGWLFAHAGVLRLLQTGSVAQKYTLTKFFEEY